MFSFIFEYYWIEKKVIAINMASLVVLICQDPAPTTNTLIID